MKNKIIVAVSFIIAGGGCFYAGMKYDQSKAGASLSNFAQKGNFANLTNEERQARMRQLGANGGDPANGQRVRMAGGGIAGEIISKDDQSITIKIPDGGSKIILYSDSTQIVKSSSGSKEDLSAGIKIFVNGTASSDGSIAAQSIQIR